MMCSMTARQLLSGLTLACSVASLSACRDPAELSGAVTAVLVVVGVDDDNVVEVDINGASRRAAPKAGDNLVSFSLPLPAGTHSGTVVVFEIEDEDEGEVERPRDCGIVTIVVPEVLQDGPVFSAVVADDLGECPEAEEDLVDDIAEEPSDDGSDDGGSDDGV
jgi:hypothetical protein